MLKQAIGLLPTLAKYTRWDVDTDRYYYINSSKYANIENLFEEHEFKKIPSFICYYRMKIKKYTVP